jgi:hypothetical protein
MTGARKIQSAITAFLLLSAAPVLAAGLVPCGGATEPVCSWPYVYVLFNKVINFLIFDFGVPLAILTIVVSGIELVLHRDNATANRVWKERIQKALLGLVIIMCAYLLVKVIVWGLTGSSIDPYQLREQVKQ